MPKQQPSPIVSRRVPALQAAAAAAAAGNCCGPEQAAVTAAIAAALQGQELDEQPRELDASGSASLLLPSISSGLLNLSGDMGVDGAAIAAQAAAARAGAGGASPPPPPRHKWELHPNCTAFAAARYDADYRGELEEFDRLAQQHQQQVAQELLDQQLGGSFDGGAAHGQQAAPPAVALPNWQSHLHDLAPASAHPQQQQQQHACIDPGVEPTKQAAQAAARDGSGGAPDPGLEHRGSPAKIARTTQRDGVGGGGGYKGSRCVKANVVGAGGGGGGGGASLSVAVAGAAEGALPALAPPAAARIMLLQQQQQQLRERIQLRRQVVLQLPQQLLQDEQQLRQLVEQCQLQLLHQQQLRQQQQQQQSGAATPALAAAPASAAAAPFASGSNGNSPATDLEHALKLLAQAPRAPTGALGGVKQLRK